jgi:hypothetical protein
MDAMDSSKEFLNPSSMLTPGLAGGMTMAITNVLARQFDLVAPGPAWLGLGLSFLFGLLVWMSQEVSQLKRVVLYVLNSLVIFVVAVGSNSVGAGAASAAPEPRPVSWSDILMSSAHAQTASASQVGWCCAGDKLQRLTREACGQARGKFATEESTARAACVRPTAAKEPPKDKPFFRGWIK